MKNQAKYIISTTCKITESSVVSHQFLVHFHINLGQLLDPGQVDDRRVSLVSVYGLTSVTVHMSFRFLGPTLRGVVTMLHVNRTQKLPSGQESSCACSSLMLKINVIIKGSRKH